MQPLPSGQIPREPWSRTFLPLLWGGGRLFLVVALAYLLRKPLLDLIEATVGIIEITQFMIDRGATPLTRLVLAVAAFVGFFATARLSARFFPQRSFVISIAAAAFLTLVLTLKTGGGFIPVICVTAVLATNWARISPGGSSCIGRLVAIPPGIGEVFFASRYFDWMAGLLRRGAKSSSAGIPRIFPGALIGALALAALVPGKKLARYERAMRSGPDVRVFARGDYNGLALDQDEGRLFATGHGLKRLFSFDTANLDAMPMIAEVDTGYSQGLAIDTAQDEIFVYDSYSRQVLVLDTKTLALKRSIPAPDISPGDPWIEFDPKSGTLSIASEADEQTGEPFVVLDRKTGAVLDRRDLEAGNLLVNPEVPILYASFFRRVSGVIAYDLEKRDIIAKTPTDARMDRMAYDPLHKEVLIASPAEGRIQRFDALTLEPREPFPAIFGVRVIAVDAPRGVMLVGSMATGKIALIGLADRKVRKSWYLGPWLRSILIAPAKGVAYVSSETTLYELNYTRSGD